MNEELSQPVFPPLEKGQVRRIKGRICEILVVVYNLRYKVLTYRDVLTGVEHNLDLDYYDNFDLIDLPMTEMEAIAWVSSQPT